MLASTHVKVIFNQTIDYQLTRTRKPAPKPITYRLIEQILFQRMADKQRIISKTAKDNNY